MNTENQSSVTYTVKQLKKMSTERLHKIFQTIKGYMLFNPYEERQFMIFSIPTIEDVDAQQHAKPEVVTTTIIPAWNEETQSIGYKLFTTDKFINRMFEAMRNHNNLSLYIPQRVETKGRKSRFSYRDVWDMLYADIQGMRLTDIAKYFETSCAVVLQVLTGVSYQWATGITEQSFK
jgi:hypothetical protein